ncbi:class I SAM-dependent methyltransferase [Cognatilysobacter xinjiangensis]|uniref:class I SAM-dependent methyltransferase n=1 Tax=Cognatilysobacter xinjiangensis TaxID=546892 RepID=UPI0016737FAC|nr:class I SAM-dependent methyltransferase [Lysobacter xinjiangensis]
MAVDYAEIFEIRGQRYHRAMLSQPRARANEFARLFDVAPPSAGQRVLDVPAGGGYLGQWLGDRVQVTSLELTDGFGHSSDVIHAPANWPDALYDHAVCLAALHHISDRPAFLGLLRDRVRPGGTIHLADVHQDSPLTGFLDGFVGRYNLTGHHGDYLRADDDLYGQLGRVIRCEEASCPWVFPSEPDMLDFCSELFGLEGHPEDALATELRSIGVRHAADGSVELDWRLLYIDIEVRP